MINDNTSVSLLQSPNHHRPAQQLLCACQIICAAGSFTLGTERPGCICLLWHRSSQRLLDHTWLWPAPVLHTEWNPCLQPLSICKPVTDSTTFAARQSGADSLRASIETCVLCPALLQDRESTPGGKKWARLFIFFAWFSMVGNDGRNTQKSFSFKGLKYEEFQLLFWDREDLKTRHPFILATFVPGCPGHFPLLVSKHYVR